MSTFHLFEFEDQPWFYPLIRRHMTDYLDFTARLSTVPFESLVSRLARVLFTYLIPLIPLISLWDGDELKRMTESIDAKDYTWECGTMRMSKGPGNATCLIGTPTRDDTA